MDIFTKKSLALIFMLVCASWGAFARIVSPNFEPSSSDGGLEVAYNLPSSFVQYEVPKEQQNEISVNKAFKGNFNGCEGEVRYLFFDETGTNGKPEITIYESLILMSVAGTRMKVQKRGDYKAVAVKKSFNADSGSFVSIVQPNSSFAAGYKYMYVDFFYKSGQGICARTFLYNDTAFVDGDDNSGADFYKNCAAFKFMKKNRKGNYIRPKR